MYVFLEKAKGAIYFSWEDKIGFMKEEILMLGFEDLVWFMRVEMEGVTVWAMAYQY